MNFDDFLMLYENKIGTKKNQFVQKIRKTERNCQDFFFQSNFSKTEIIVDVERVINHFWRKKNDTFFCTQCN